MDQGGTKKFPLSSTSRAYALAPRCYTTGSIFRCRSKAVMTQQGCSWRDHFEILKHTPTNA